MRYEYTDLLQRGITAITAHSGCEGTPPNSIEHIRSAIASGAEFIEIDVRHTGDLFYLSHDLPENPRECVPLATAFELISQESNLYMNLDVKEQGLVTPVLELAENYGLCRRIVFTGEANGARAEANARGAEMWRSMWQGDSVPEGIAANLRDGSPALNVDQVMLTEEYHLELRSHGGGFSVWTVNNEAAIRRFLDMGVMNITTQRPLLALRLREEIQLSKRR